MLIVEASYDCRMLLHVAVAGSISQSRPGARAGGAGAGGPGCRVFVGNLAYSSGLSNDPYSHTGNVTSAAQGVTWQELKDPVVTIHLAFNLSK